MSTYLGNINLFTYTLCFIIRQPEYVDLLNTYVLNPFRRLEVYVSQHRFQRVMHSVLSTRIMLHVRNTTGIHQSRSQDPSSTHIFTTVITHSEEDLEQDIPET